MFKVRFIKDGAYRPEELETFEEARTLARHLDAWNLEVEVVLIEVIPWKNVLNPETCEVVG